MFSLDTLNRASVAVAVRAQIHVSSAIGDILNNRAATSVLHPVSRAVLLFITQRQVATDACADFETQVSGAILNVTHILVSIGIAVGVIGIVIGGLMRATSFGNERRIAASNAAITAAVIGVVIVLVATAANGALSSLVPGGSANGGGCTAAG